MKSSLIRISHFIVLDLQNYKDAMKANFETFKSFTELLKTKCFVYVLSDDDVFCTVEFKGKIPTMDYQESPYNACWTFVFKKFESEWNVIQENGAHTH